MAGRDPAIRSENQSRLVAGICLDMPGHDGWGTALRRDFRSGCRKTMHAEHADKTELSELPGRFAL
jgi:hypothetical protein